MPKSECSKSSAIGQQECPDCPPDKELGPIPDTQCVKTQEAQPLPEVSEVLVLARVSSEYTPDIRDALVRMKNIIPNYGGKVLGLAPTATVLDSTPAHAGRWSRPMCVLAIHFPNHEVAARWAFSDPIFRNKDFPSPSSSVEIMGLKMRLTFPKGVRTFQMSTFDIPDENCEKFQSDFVEPASKFYDKYRVRNALVSTRDIADLNSAWVKRGSYIVLHGFESEDQLTTLYKDAEYVALREVANSLSQNHTVAFTVT